MDPVRPGPATVGGDEERAFLLSGQFLPAGRVLMGPGQVECERLRALHEIFEMAVTSTQVFDQLPAWQTLRTENCAGAR